MTTIKDIVTMIRNSAYCCKPKVCSDCEGYTFCRVNTMYIALEYIEREGII